VNFRGGLEDGKGAEHVISEGEVAITVKGRGAVAAKEVGRGGDDNWGSYNMGGTPPNRRRVCWERWIAEKNCGRLGRSPETGTQYIARIPNKEQKRTNRGDECW